MITLANNNVLKFFRHYKRVLLQILYCLLTIPLSNGQETNTDFDTLSLKDTDCHIQNTICLYISGSDYEAITAVSGGRIAVNPKLLTINADTLNFIEISTRGQTTLYYRRKSYSFDLHSEATFHHGEKTKPLKKFFVLGLAMDRNYVNNRLAFEMMETLKLLHLFYTYGELRINDQSEGICMIVERPGDWALKKKDSPLVIRRGYNNSMDQIKTRAETDKDTIKKYRNNFNQLYLSLNKYEDEELYLTISTWLDTDIYMKWLAFNYFVRNGDYTDEVYFYVSPGTKKFRVIPWDYDDIFSASPHEGYDKTRKSTDGKLIFSVEDRLDKKIISDPYLYKMYLVQLESVLNELSPDVLKTIFENAYSELYPYYLNQEIISQSTYDRHKNINLPELKSRLEGLYNQLLVSRRVLLNTIEGQGN
jgi:spore coat protein H